MTSLFLLHAGSAGHTHWEVIAAAMVIVAAGALSARWLFRSRRG